MKLKKIIKKILCMVGIHDWTVTFRIDDGYMKRTCNKCGCRQRGSYDMMYGTTNWEKG